jgi:hypothetical protein
MLTKEGLHISAANLMKIYKPEDQDWDGRITWKCTDREQVLRMGFEGLRITSGTQFCVSNTEVTASNLDTILNCKPSGADAEIRFTS